MLSRFKPPAGTTKAESEALQGVLAETLDSQLATKTDLIKLERRLGGCRINRANQLA